MERYFVFLSCDYAEYLFHGHCKTLEESHRYVEELGKDLDEGEREVDWTYKIYDFDFFLVAKGQVDTGWNINV